MEIPSRVKLKKKMMHVNGTGNILTACEVWGEMISLFQREMFLENFHCHLALSSSKLNVSFENQALYLLSYTLFSLPAL